MKQLTIIEHQNTTSEQLRELEDDVRVTKDARKVS